jgi:hypothetical protein
MLCRKFAPLIGFTVYQRIKAADYGTVCPDKKFVFKKKKEKDEISTPFRELEGKQGKER